MGLIGYGAAWDLGRAIAGATRRATRDRYATVTRRDPDGVTWGTIAGASGEVPLGGSLADAEVGDVVAVDWRGGVPVASGNATSPAVGARRVEGAVAPVRAASVAAQGAARAAQSVADAAQRVAEAVGQHFFADDGGIHVTAATQDEWETSHSGANVLLNSAGQLFRDGLNNLLTLTTEGGARALTIWDGLGNAAGNVRAVFGEVITLGGSGESHAVIDYHSLQLVDKESNSNTYFHVSDLRDTSGYATYTLNATGNGERVTFTVYGCPSISEIVSATVDGVSDENVTIGPDYPNNVTFQTAPSNGSEVVIVCKSDSAQSKAYTLGVRGASSFGINGLGAMSVAEGIGNVAAGVMSHAEGGHNLAAGLRSHVEGEGSQATGHDAHAEGMATRAAGIGSHAEGRASEALGEFSHAQNHGTIASGDCQTAIGRWSVNSGGTYALIIGNGTRDNARSNALTVGWDGTVECAGEVVPAIASEALTRDSGASSWSSGTVRRSCKVVTVTINEAKLASALASGGTSGTITTIPDGYRPSVVQRVPACISSSGNYGNVWFAIGASGAVQLANRSGVQIPTSAAVSLNVTYIID